MTITLKLKPEIEQRLLAEAAAQGLAVETLLENLIETQLPQQTVKQPSSETMSYEEWESTLRSFTNSPAFAGKPHLSDEAISRESIYTREDEQL